MSDDWIGLRVARYRDLAGLTQMQLAERVGKSRPYISQIENGDRSVTTRALLIALAQALGVATTDLTGAPRSVRDTAERPLHVAVPQIRAALAGALPLQRLTSEDLAHDVRAIMAARMACDYPAIATLLPSALANVRGNELGMAGEQLEVRLLFTASMVLRPLGYLDLAARMADEAAAAALNTDSADYPAAAAFARSQCLLATGGQGMAELALNTALDATDRTEPYWSGLLYLQASLAAASIGAHNESDDYLDEAADLARVVQSQQIRDGWLMDFNPANVGVWRVAAALEGPDPGRAVDLAADITIGELTTVQRKAHLLMHTAHGHYARGEHDTATALLRQAAAMAPTEIRGRGRVREVVAHMLRDARRKAGGQQLRDLAVWVGVDPLETT